MLVRGTEEPQEFAHEQFATDIGGVMTGSDRIQDFLQSLSEAHATSGADQRVAVFGFLF